MKKDSDYLNVADRYLADVWPQERKKMLNRIVESYRKAPYFKAALPLIDECFLFEETNLFRFIFHSLQKIKDYLRIRAELTISSSIPINHNLRGEEKVISICIAMNSTTYINPFGGVDLYNADYFRSKCSSQR